MKLSILMPLKRDAVIAGADAKFDEEGYFINDRVSARNRLVTGEVDSNIVTHVDAATNQTIGANASLFHLLKKIA